MIDDDSVGARCEMDFCGVVPEKIDTLWRAYRKARDVLARVSAGYTDVCRVNTASGSCLAELSGRYRYTLRGPEDLPVVGDWVVIDREGNENGRAVISHLFPRLSVIERTAAGSSAHERQLLAANVDVIGICMALNRDYNLRRLERYLTLVWNSGALPLVILTKTDLCDDPAALVADAEASAVGVDVITTTTEGEAGFAALEPYLKAGRTIAFIGSSGTGKSTLINHLLGSETAAARGLRSDGKGRHTTTVRELYLLPGGCALVDTPGLREIQLGEGASAQELFADIEELVRKCRFSDCTHAREPGCAVRQAVDEGLLDEGRLRSYEKLQHEISYRNLTSRQREKKKVDRMFGDFESLREARDYIKGKKHREKG